MEVIKIESNVENAKTEQEMRIEQFAKLLNTIKLDINANKESGKKFSTKFSKQQVQKYLEDPRRYEKELRDVTKALCVLSPQFNRLVGYVPDMALFNYILIPRIDKLEANKKDKYAKDFFKWANYLDVLNIKHEFEKIVKSNFKFDVFYGYILESPDSFYIKPINPDFCKIVSVDDGVFNYAFNFEFFDKDGKDFLESYPKEFQQKYKTFKSKGKDFKWQELDSANTICTKYYEDMVDVAYPPYCNTFNDLYDITDYKQIDKQGAENENYQLIGLQLETNSKNGEPNAFTVDPEQVANYYNLLQMSLPEGIGAFLSPVKWDTAKFANTGGQNAVDRVQNATRNFWDGAGVSSVLFSSGANNAGSLKYSMLVDANMLFVIYRQLERWLNKKLKKVFKGKVFIKLLDMNRLNQQEFVDQQLKVAQYGIPNKTMLASSIGLSPAEMMALNTLECDVLNLTEKLIPLASSHTQNGEEGTPGKPPKKDTDLGDKGEETRKNSSNENKD